MSSYRDVTVARKCHSS